MKFLHLLPLATCALALVAHVKRDSLELEARNPHWDTASWHHNRPTITVTTTTTLTVTAFPTFNGTFSANATATSADDLSPVTLTDLPTTTAVDGDDTDVPTTTEAPVDSGAPTPNDIPPITLFDPSTIQGLR